MDRRNNSNSNTTGLMPPPGKTSTLFVGDLSVLCNEEKLFELFHRFGAIESIRLKKSDNDPQKAHLSYGFVKFFTPEDALRAYDQVNGLFFLGRNLRLGWADDHPTGSKFGSVVPPTATVPPKKSTPTAQVHVTFNSPNLTSKISELDLRNVFEVFGNVVDVVVKKGDFHPEMGVQSGYGFIHFQMTEEGIQSALTAIEEVNKRKKINEINFECALTHSLKTHLLSRRTGSYAGMPRNFGMSSYPNPTPLEKRSMPQPVSTTGRGSVPFQPSYRPIIHHPSRHFADVDLSGPSRPAVPHLQHTLPQTSQYSWPPQASPMFSPPSSMPRTSPLPFSQFQNNIRNDYDLRSMSNDSSHISLRPDQSSLSSSSASIPLPIPPTDHHLNNNNTSNTNGNIQSSNATISQSSSGSHYSHGFMNVFPPN